MLSHLLLILPLVNAALGGVQIHGHRGSRGTHPENTLPAFREAFDAGAHVLELDLQLSQDDIPIVSHDPVLEGKLCRDPAGTILAKKIPVNSLTAAQIGTYDCGSVFNPQFPQQKLVQNTPKPTFDQVLAWVESAAPGIELNVETKMNAVPKPDPDRFAALVLDRLRAHHLLKRAILQSFDFSTLEAARKLEPGLRLSALHDDAPDFCDLTASGHFSIASPFLGLVSGDAVTRCHALGLEVIPWTANDPVVWDELLAAGVDAIITDYPRRLVEYLAAKAVSAETR